MDYSTCKPAYYSRNHSSHVVDPLNLAVTPNASVGSLNQGEGQLWPTGIQATNGAPGVLKGVYATDTMALGITHCLTWHLDALANDPHFVVYEIMPSRPRYSNFVNTPQIGFFKCDQIIDVSPTMVANGQLVITHI